MHEINSFNNNNEYLKLDGKEFVTTIFNPIDKNSMILILGDNITGLKDEPIFIHLYLSKEGKIQHGIDSFIFFNTDCMWEFVNNLPNMNASDYIFSSIGVRPGYY
ncbi:hypothetical protein CSV71_14245 [Sporosarcina sp. P21c]|uniref:hypothetical protein n=1 Tax=Sporosarcina sp. P21c TaxID=2048255 RepID=UPI000C16F36C|nr:hypothetical protein [Sporosarcina sp. P21c]PIC88546.1 hypothetical protein CSV71_14245 [Sporosarcina sp. P21c]